jgi:hypothetical protein
MSMNRREPLRIDLGRPLPELKVLASADGVDIHAHDADASRLEQLLLDLRAARRLKMVRLRSRLTAFPAALTELTRLQQLEIADPVLPGLSRSIDRLTRLRSLRLETLHLASFPRSIGALQKLRELHVDSNHLSRLPEPIGELRELRTLALVLRRVIVPDWERPAYFRSRFEQTLPELFTLLAALPKLSYLTLAEPPRDNWCPDPIFQNLPPELALLESLQVLTLEVSYPVQLPLGASGLERLPTIVAVNVRFDHSDEEINAALPHTQIVTK